MTKTRSRLRVGLVVPHIFMQDSILPDVIFSPGTLALDLANGLQRLGVETTLFSPGSIATSAKNIMADLSYFESELEGRGDEYIDLLKKHPFTFVTLARQVQAELIAKAFKMANDDKLDIIHIYTNEEDIALPFAQFCQKPVVFTHHDPFNFLVRYKSVFPKYPYLNWISLSLAQRKGMPKNTHWVGNIYHGLDKSSWKASIKPADDYVACLGRIIEPKGVHLAIKAVKHYNLTAKKPLKLKIAGKHYAEHTKDVYWQTHIEPELNETVEYIGFIKDTDKKQTFLSNAQALLMPSLFDEPFGMSMIEALACGTPVIGLDSGAIPEVIINGENGLLVKKVQKIGADQLDEEATAQAIALALGKLNTIQRTACREDFENRFSLERMCQEHKNAYLDLIQSQDQS